MPQLPAGERIEPHVSEPIANGTSPAATAEPEPLEEPPLQASRPHGLIPGPVNAALGWRKPMPPASSTIASFAHSTAPASSSRRIAVASKSNTRSLNGAAPHVV